MEYEAGTGCPPQTKRWSTRHSQMKISIASALIMVWSSVAKPAAAFAVGANSASSSTTARFSSSTESEAAAIAANTPENLPEFKNAEEYLAYLETVSALPKGFATGTAKGSFVPVEAPAMGKLPIKGTVIYVTKRPTDSWAAVFTKNRVCQSLLNYFTSCIDFMQLVVSLFFFASIQLATQSLN